MVSYASLRYLLHNLGLTGARDSRLFDNFRVFPNCRIWVIGWIGGMLMREGRTSDNRQKSSLEMNM